jgi:four helix bundle suffix protein
MGAGNKRVGGNPERPDQTAHARSLVPSTLAANAALLLLKLACHLLTPQLERQARDFEQQGGFTERLYRVCSAKRRKQ